MILFKFIPLMLSWGGIMLVLLRGFPERRAAVAATGPAGFLLGTLAAALLFRFFQGKLPFEIIRLSVGAGFLILWAGSVLAIYQSTVRNFSLEWGRRMLSTAWCAGTCAVLAGVIAGAVTLCRLPEADGKVAALLLIVMAAGVMAMAAIIFEKSLPPSFSLSPSGVMAAVAALLLFSSSSIIRLDLFSPLTMKVMKFSHDFIHQFFESMLIPDHLFVRISIWRFIGLLFSNGVGFWGGLFIWFMPLVLVVLATQYERLPSVAHIRQGTQRRKMIAAAVRARRLRLIVPLASMLIAGLAVYQSLFPSVEYWDPKPMLITATPAGEIFIPKKGETNLADGKLHKFLYKQEGKEARFFILMTPARQLTVVLDACAICKPDGYGQAEGTVICYYCKTLIPLETVGKPGGCNPVPIPFEEKEDGVHVDALTLINSWGKTVQATTRVKEGGK